jgi:ABC-type branched-subunit amino acid transport system substrate-binding protein
MRSTPVGLALLVVLLLAGCSREASEPESRTVLGVLLPLSGPESKGAANLLAGLELGARHADPSIRVVARDDAGDPAISSRRWRELVRDESVIAVVGGWHASTARPLAALAHEVGVPFVALSPLAATSLHGDVTIPSLHRIESAGLAAAGWAREVREAQTAGVWADSTREASVRCGRAFAEEFTARGGNVAWWVGPDEDGRTSRPAGAPNPVNVVFVAGPGDLLGELREFGAGADRAAYLFVEGWPHPEPERGGPPLFLLRPTAPDPEAADWEAFEAACRSAGIDPGVQAARGWDVGGVLAGILGKARTRSGAMRALRDLGSTSGVTGGLALGAGPETVALFALEPEGERGLGRVPALATPASP